MLSVRCQQKQEDFVYTCRGPFHHREIHILLTSSRSVVVSQCARFSVQKQFVQGAQNRWVCHEPRNKSMVYFHMICYRCVQDGTSNGQLHGSHRHLHGKLNPARKSAVVIAQLLYLTRGDLNVRHYLKLVTCHSYSVIIRKLTMGLLDPVAWR